jgi:hypothetical protein
MGGLRRTKPPPIPASIPAGDDEDAMSEQNLRLDVEDRVGAAAVLEVSIRRDTVELRLRGTMVGITDRPMLRRWVRQPDGMYVCDELTWLWNGYSIGIYVRDQIPASFLRPKSAETLRKHL